MSVSPMPTTVIIPVGSLRDRHINGVNMLKAKSEVDAFVVVTTSKKFAQGLYSVLTNAHEIMEQLDAIPITADPLVEVEVARAFMEIYEGQSKKFMDILERRGREEEEKKHPMFLVDITSTTKVVIRVAFVFAILFGFQPYTVAAKQTYSNVERTKRLLDRLFDPGKSRDLNKIGKIMSGYHARPKQALERLQQLLQQRTAEINYELKAESIGEKIQQSQMPVLKPIQLTHTDRLALTKLRQKRDSYESIKDLALAMGRTGKSDQVSLGYRIKKLTQWALVSDTGSKQLAKFASEREGTRPARVGAKRKIELTDIGKGIADALKISESEWKVSKAISD